MIQYIMLFGLFQLKVVISISSYAGLYFQYDGVPSQNYDLKIVEINTSEFRFDGGSQMETITDKTMRSQEHTLLGTYPNNRLEFQIEIVHMGEAALSSEKAHIVKSWLFGKLHWCNLYLFNQDLANVYFECTLKDPEDIVINGNIGWKCTVSCNAGGAWKNQKSVKHQITSSPMSIIYNNTSDDNDYNYPTIMFTSTNGGSFSIVNQADDNREMKFEELLAGETITIDGKTRRITSSLPEREYLILQNFNKKYLRFKQGVNRLTVTGEASNLSFMCKNFYRIGG